MDDQMKAEDSYAERRLLFKDIWDTAMKDVDDANKPKVIKTLKLDEIDRYSINKRKKLKLKKLRHVCRKILDFRNQKEYDRTYGQVNATQTPAMLK